MPVAVSTIEVGNCYVTITRQVRKVLEINGEQVRYASRGGKPVKDWEKHSYNSIDIAKFANDVEHQVTCDWDPDYPERKP